MEGAPQAAVPLSQPGSDLAGPSWPQLHGLALPQVAQLVSLILGMLRAIKSRGEQLASAGQALFSGLGVASLATGSYMRTG